MSKKLPYGEKVSQALALRDHLVKASAGADKLSREQIRDIYKTSFRPQWQSEHPGEKCGSFSVLRYVLTTKGHLMKMSNDEFHFTDSAGLYMNGTSPTSSNEVKTARRPRQRKVAWVAVDQHLATSRSQQQEKPKADMSFQMQEVDGGIFCRLCNVRVATESEAAKHMAGRKHYAYKVTAQLKVAGDALRRNQNDIHITAENMSDAGTIFVDVEEGEMKTVLITINNNNVVSSVIFRRCELIKHNRVFKLSDERGVTDNTDTYTISPSTMYQVRLTVMANNVNIFKAKIGFTFSFEGAEDDDEFLIIRNIYVKCENALVEELAPRVEYHPPPRISSKPVDVEIVEGLPLPVNSNEQLERDINLDLYLVDKRLRNFVNRGLVKDQNKPEEYGAAAEKIKKLLAEGLNRDNHEEWFHTLLAIEEIQMEVDIRKYDMLGVTMEVDRNNPRLLTLKVPGLAENRPSVLRGDRLYVRKLDSQNKPQGCEYKGHVHDVGPDKVHLGFGQRLLDQFFPNMKFSVRYDFNRLPQRVQHRAVKLAAEHSLGHLVFPTLATASLAGSVPTANIRFFDQRVAANKEQQAAVNNILQGSSRPAPYLIFGPPGTGKTVTMVEAIKQVISRISSSHALVCAPSNDAADLLTERLLAHLDKSWVYRMNAASRAWGGVSEKVKPVSNYNKTLREYCYPAKRELCRYRIIICTLVTAGRIVSANFPAGHFTHVFVDEAGQSSEPEGLIPIAGVLEVDDIDPDGGLELAITGQCVLAGDPRQLGAVIRSPIAMKHDLGLSFLERLMTKCDVYKRIPQTNPHDAPYNPKVLTKLVRNYRSHPSILHLPNIHFYDNELEVHADPLVRESMCRWEELPKKGFPIIFHGTTAEEQREERSPSFFNATEVSEVIRYVEQLLAMRGGQRLTAKDIGIISPYRKQVQKIRKALQIRKLSNDIKVGSVEEFQGQERHVIIISTVRTSPEYLSMDLAFKLGFLKNPKRFNVAITRAKALLIVVGNPYVLSKDVHWNSLLEYCVKNGAYKGVEYEPEEEELEDIVQRFQSLNLDKHVERTSISMKQAVEEPEWRKDV